MIEFLRPALPAFLWSLVSAGIGSFGVMKLLVKLKSRQTVSSHAPETHQKKQGTPTMGGLIILLGWIMGLLLSGVLGSNFGKATLALIGGFAVIGFVDDFVVPQMMPGKRGLGWKQKILMQFVAAAAPLILFNPGFSTLQFAVAVIVVLFFANAFNFVDGLDWLAGTVLIGMIIGALAMMTYQSSAPIVVVALLSLLGGLIPFMLWNRPKAKVFMGDVGSLPIGGFLGYLSLELYFNLEQTTPGAAPEPGSTVMLSALIVWSVVMICELVPVPLQIASVKLRKKRLFPYTPIHHAFEKAGWKETKVVALFAAVQLLCSLIAWSLVRAS